MMLRDWPGVFVSEDVDGVNETERDPGTQESLSTTNLESFKRIVMVH